MTELHKIAIYHLKIDSLSLKILKKLNWMKKSHKKCKSKFHPIKIWNLSWKQKWWMCFFDTQNQNQHISWLWYCSHTTVSHLWMIFMKLFNDGDDNDLRHHTSITKNNNFKRKFQFYTKHILSTCNHLRVNIFNISACVCRRIVDLDNLTSIVTG